MFLKFLIIKKAHSRCFGNLYTAESCQQALGFYKLRDLFFGGGEGRAQVLGRPWLAAELQVYCCLRICSGTDPLRSARFHSKFYTSNLIQPGKVDGSVKFCG